MSYRQVFLATNEFYHVFNKSVGDTEIFTRQDNLNRLFDLIPYYLCRNTISFSHFTQLSDNTKTIYLGRITKLPIVEIICFSIMPNHYHFLLRQIEDDGISRFISNLQNSFAKYFNIKFHRKGALFCEMFKAVRITNNNQLIHLSRYIHLNHVASKIIELNNLTEYPLSSFCHYMGKVNYDFVKPDIVLKQFENKEAHKEFVFNQADYQIKLHEVAKMLLE